MQNIKPHLAASVLGVPLRKWSNPNVRIGFGFERRHANHLR